MIEVNNEFIKKNDRLVRVIVNQYQTKGIKKQDLMQEGYLGLIEAAKRYDPCIGVQFTSYASWWIRKYIREYIIRYGQTVSLPFTNKDIFDHIIEDVDAVLYEEDGDVITFADCIADDTDTDAQWEQEQQFNRLHEVIQGLPTREQNIIRQIYGIGQKKVPQTQIARQLGVTPMTIWRIHEATLKKMKKMLI